MAVVYRLFPAALALTAFTALAILYLSGHYALYGGVLGGWGVESFRFPFLDASGALAAWDCTRLGIDVIVHDPCDVLDSSYNYSPLWMSLAALPLGRADAGLVGLALDLLFLGSLALLPPARRPFELVLVILATLSSTVAFAIERANADLLIFLLALAFGFLSVRSLPARIAAYGLALAAALIKYYPLALLVLLVRERLAVFVAVVVATVTVLAAFAAGYASEVARGIPMIPGGPYYSGFFGAKNLPFLLGDMIGHLGPPSPVLAAARAAAIATLLGALLLAAAAIARLLLRSPAVSAARQGLGALEGNLLVIGSALVVGCFFAGQNIVYRGVFLLFVLPGLLGIARNMSDAGLRRLLIGTGAAIVLLLWQEFFRLSLYALPARLGLSDRATFTVYALFWLSRELAWWWMIAVLVWVLLDFGTNSAVARTATTKIRALQPKLRRA
ncbi:MAG: hypothetical protein JO047_09670 [Alphaproteobacteria bacterium]|nr:hypothetical protein [Alphaproteobacteria bacterium]